MHRQAVPVPLRSDGTPLAGVPERVSAVPNPRLTWENTGGAARWWNTERLLTRSSVATREGLAMQATRDTTTPCIIWTGEPKRYQIEAAAALVGCGMEPSHLAWITPSCLNDCLEPTHLTAHEPLRIAYPWGICVYCGRPAATRDHLLPRTWSGDIKRKFVATVPACGTCNSLLRDTLTWSITERRDICHERLRKHFRRVLRTLDFDADELAEFGRVLRADVEDSMARKREVLRMLEWPEDPAYDLRALQHSGIEDPYAIGLLGDHGNRGAA